MEETISPKTVPTGDVFKEIQYFFLKIQAVNALAAAYLANQDKEKWPVFETAWIALLEEVREHFKAGSFKDISWPHKKSLIEEIECEINIRIYDVEDGILVGLGRTRKIKKIKISYHIADNQDDMTEGSPFPYFGLYLCVSLSDGNNNIFSIATHRTKLGCNLISPKLNNGESVIIGGSNAVKFEDKKDFDWFMQKIKLAGLIEMPEENALIGNFTVLD